MSQPSSTLSGDPFRQSGATSRATGAKSVLRATVTVILWIIIVGMGFVKTLRWCGGNFNAEASGYLIGSVLTPALLALLVMWLVNRGRREKGPIEHRHVAVAGLAFVVSLLSFAGSQTQGGPSGASIRDQVRHLVRQGAGKEAEVNANWYDEPTRDFYRDIVTFGTAAALIPDGFDKG